MSANINVISWRNSRANFFIRGVVCAFFLLQVAFVWGQSSKIDSLYAELNHAKKDSLKVMLEIKISREMHRHNYPEEKEYAMAKKAVELALFHKDTLLYARALDNLGLLYRFHHNYNQAFSLHKKAFKLIADKKVKPIYKMIFANNAGVAARYNQNYDASVLYYMKALKIAEKTNDLKDIAIASNGIGNALGNIPKRQDEAIKYFKRSLAVERQRGNSLGMAMNYLSISHYYIGIKKYDKARAYIDTLLAINTKRHDAYGLALTYECMGVCYLKEGKELNEAVSYFQNAYRRFEDLDDKYEQAQILIYLGEIERKRNQMSAAKNYYRQSLAIAEKIGHFGLLKENYLRLSRVMERQHNLKKALYYYKKSMAYKDSINLHEQSIKIEALTQKYNLAKKEARIKLLEKDQALQESQLITQKKKLKNRKIFLILLAIATVFLLIIFILQYRYRRTKKQSAALLLQKEKDKMNAVYERNLAKKEATVNRLRINPHFLFNSLNAITYLVQSEQTMEAVKYLKVFSRYTRMVLETSKEQVIPLQRELELAHYYMTLEENRFDKDFEFSIVGMDKTDIKDINIPPLLLQPFIENAIWHGLLPADKKERNLLVIVKSVDDTTQVIIDDNGVGRQSAKERKKHKKRPHKSMGMSIVDKRIDLFNNYYDEKISYQVKDKINPQGKVEGTQIVVLFNASERYEN